MIYPQDSIRLAYTKLKTRKLRLGIVLLISSLLFMVLLTGSFVVRGVFASIEKFSDTGFGKRFLIMGMPYSTGNNKYFGPTPDQALVDKLNAMHKDLVERKKVEAKKLGIEYDPKAETPYVQEYDGPPGSGKFKTIDTSIPAVNMVVAEAMQKEPGQLADFEKSLAPYNPVGVYEKITANPFGQNGTTMLRVIKNGVENFDPPREGMFGLKGTDAFVGNWSLMSSEPLKPFLLEGQNLEIGQDGSIPVIVPYTAVQQILGLTELNATATPKEQLERLKEVRQKAGGQTFEVCYRNGTSESAVTTAKDLQKQLDLNKNNKDYTAPELITDVPDKPCGDVRIVKDKRSAATKKEADKLTTFNRIFGEQAPQASIMKFRIVGINAEIDYSASVSVVSALKSVLVSSLGDGWFSPLETSKTNKTVSGIFSLDSALSVMNMRTYYAEVASAENLKKAISEVSCNSFNEPAAINPELNQTSSCSQQGKYFILMPFGSSSVALGEAQTWFNRIFNIALIVVAGLASIILIGVVGRIIADSRRETAVFRAIGAKRFDISQIYITYVLFIAVIIAAMSTSLGYLLARLAESRYTQDLTVQALLAFNVKDLNQYFSLASFDLGDIFKVWGLIVVASLVASIIPLLVNVRRNPIGDMRDER